MIEADYLIVGAGAMGMAFADSILAGSDATIAIVDRGGAPGGHWNRAYPFVRLHQPSAFYGVNSRELSSGRRDERGGNAGLSELASGAEVVAYFDQVMRRHFLPSGRVRYFPMSEYREGNVITSLVSGETQTVSAKKVVDGTYSAVNVPSMRPPPFPVAEGMRCVALNALPSLDYTPSRYVVIGSGKTGIDAVLWLLDAGVDPGKIAWIMPRDAWLLNRASLQPGPESFATTVGGFANESEAAALATSVDDLFERLEAVEQLLRIDRSVQPTMYRCATVSKAEIEQLRAVTDVVRMGHVQAITATEIVLDHGAIPTSADTLHIDCTADGLARRPAVPVFDGNRITLQNVRTCQPSFSAALIGHVEAIYDDVARKNELCTPIPYPDTHLDWLPMTLANSINQVRWSQDPELAAWMGASRLDILSRVAFEGPPDDAQRAAISKLGQHAPAARANLPRLMEQAATA